MDPGCIGKSNTNNLPAHTDLTENPDGKKKLVFKDATQKSAPLVLGGIEVELEPTEPIFEKCPHLRDHLVGGGADQNLGSFGIGCPVQYYLLGGSSKLRGPKLFS
jgi:hypothetical protein